MGFWHTGYMEFHEPVGFDPDWSWQASAPSFPCAHCRDSFTSIEELRKHRFEAHPLHRPVMFIRSSELGTQRVRITRSLAPSDVRVDGCDSAVLNGNEVPVSDLAQELAGVSSDVCRVVLSRDSVDAKFELDIRVASDEDMVGVEEQFRRTALGRQLNTRAVERFVTDAKGYRSAIGYCDGICAYLYGVLARERATDSSLTHDAYVGKFTKAAEELAAYDRPLARIIGCLIAFHFNHFQDAARLSPDSRVGRVAARYAAWIDSRRQSSVPVSARKEALKDIEILVTDWGSETILRWGRRPLLDLAKDVENIEVFLGRDLAEFDKIKVRILLGEIYAASGHAGHALKYAKGLRNVLGFDEWAENLIRTLSEDSQNSDDE